MQYNNYHLPHDERIAGGFIAPFLLGGITGAVLTPYFVNRPYYQPYPYQYPYYYPYRNWGYY